MVGQCGRIIWKSQEVGASLDRRTKLIIWLVICQGQEGGGRKRNTAFRMKRGTLAGVGQVVCGLIEEYFQTFALKRQSNSSMVQETQKNNPCFKLIPIKLKREYLT